MMPPLRAPRYAPLSSRTVSFVATCRGVIPVALERRGAGPRLPVAACRRPNAALVTSLSTVLAASSFTAHNIDATRHQSYQLFA
ncbi:hypothetical protein HYPSUDRAFT_34752 [Hypholoma sublateritium FD-334 SS-4]|uniref:Uncharacterized protein n=1 Tax=Hypholoma sublateritium (strain FD-334 SS-4) TaxID=945553 RepID=A0A0D2PGF7_HYPSF|nr:hypothetical protein HYPSUDRAFT_34752 [Hypholoma sublateritium FD-334 SS-4]